MANSRAIEAARAFVRIVANDEQLKKTLNSVRANLSDLSNSINDPRILAGLAGIAAGGVGILKVAASAEQTAVAFEVMLGSASQAKTMLDQIYQLGKESPFGAADFQTAAKTLLQFGVSASEVIPAISMLGDVAAGDSERLKSLALVFGQVSAAGRLTGGDVLQMINNGFNPLQQIAATTGESMIELRKRMEAGGISAMEVAAAFQAATTGTGRFAGMTQRIAKTTGGVYAALADEVMMLAKTMGDVLLPVANVLLAAVQKMVAVFAQFPKAIVVTGAAILGFVAAVKVVNAALALYAMRQAIATALTGPKGWILLAGAAAAAAVALGAINAATADTAAAAEQTADPLDTMAKEFAAADAAATGFNATVKDAPKDLTQLRKTIDDLIDPLGEAYREARAFADELAAAGVSTQQGSVLVRAMIEDKAGFTGMMQDMQDEIRKLQGTATDASIALENMAAAGVDPARLAQLKQLVDQRDAILKKQQDDQYYEEQQKEMEQAADAVKTAIQSASQALAKERSRLQVLTDAGLITKDDAQKFLEQNPEFKALMSGADFTKTIQSTVTPTGVAQDLRSVSGAGQLTGIINQQGTLSQRQVQLLQQIQQLNARQLKVAEQGQIGFVV
jgi:tape measure domain-containing protein